MAEPKRCRGSDQDGNGGAPYHSSMLGYKLADIVTDHLCAGEVSRQASDDAIRLNNRPAAVTPFILFKQVRRFGSLDGWRACAIVAVLWHHTLGNASAAAVAHAGRHGVTLFFVISGFLIITLLLRSQDSPAGFTVWKFWGRRALRIFPIYYAVLLVYAVLVHYADHSPTGAAFFANIPIFVTFTTNWLVGQSDHTIFYFSWSIAAEEQFYLIWPLIEVLVAPPSLKFILLGVIAVVSQIAFYYTGGDDVGSLPIRMMANVPLGITLGTALAHLFHHEASFRAAYRFLGRRGSAFGCLGMTVAVAILSSGSGFAEEVAMPVAFTMLVAATVMREDNDLAGLLSWHPMVWIGTVSYGMYMMHMLAINVVKKADLAFGIDVPVVFFVGSVALAVAVASLSFLCFEKPLLVLKERLFGSHVNGR